MKPVDVAVCGGGIAGVCAAISAARNGAEVVLIERGGSLGGTLTEGSMSYIMDSANKGGILRELFDFLNRYEMTGVRRGKRVDENGRKIPGPMADVEGSKYFFDKACAEAGVKVLYYSHVTAVEFTEESGFDNQKRAIDRILISTECGNYSLKAALFVDATGNGLVADFAGCSWECGDPVEKRPSPASMGVSVIGFPADYDGTNSIEEKTEYGQMLMENQIHISSEQASVVKSVSLRTWGMGINFQYGVMPDDIESLSVAVTESRKEIFEVIEKHKKVKGYEGIYAIHTPAHIGIREGRRILGEYRLCNGDIIEGRRFEDGICLVTMTVDVHKLDSNDTLDCERGVKTKPYHIPYRCLVAKECRNLMLAGRCISGDFYPHASYRVMGNMAATGEAAGYAAACCVKEHVWPAQFDGKRASRYMKLAGYEI